MYNPILNDFKAISTDYNHVLTCRSIHDLKSNLTVLYGTLKDKYKQKDIIEFIDTLTIKNECNIEEYYIKRFKPKRYIKELIKLSN